MSVLAAMYHYFLTMITTTSVEFRFTLLCFCFVLFRFPMDTMCLRENECARRRTTL